MFFWGEKEGWFFEDTGMSFLGEEGMGTFWKKMDGSFLGE